MQFFIPYTFPTLNEIIAAKGSTNGKKGARWYRYTKIKNEAIEATMSAIYGPYNKTYIIELVDGPYCFQFDWYCENKRKDPDNISAGQKFIFDGLVRACVLPNDGWREVATILHTFDSNPSPYGYGVMVTIES